MPPVIVINDLEWRYEHRKSFALQKINLEIEENSFVGIVGANEHGKTTLVSAINGLIPHSHNGIYRGSVNVFDQTVRDMDALELATKVGMVFADPESQFTAMTVEEELSFGLENMGYNLNDIREHIQWAAEITMIEDLLDKSPYDISGGQKQRVAIACVLAMNPPIIIMDEPTSMIDPLGKRLIFDILNRLKNEGKHTLIVVEHNLERLAPLADYMLLMVNGKIDRMQTARDFFADPEYLEQIGVTAPESTNFVQWLKREGYVSEETPAPLGLEEAIEISRAAIQNRRPAA
jgi:energy-coupling factor transporter ATP-binding protein EcfA2